MNTHTSYFTFSVAEVVQAVKRGWGEGEGRVGSSQGIGPDGTGQELLTAEKVLWGVGGFPLFGGAPFKKVPKQGRKEGGGGFFLPANPPGGRGILYRSFSKRRSAPGLAKKHNLPRETKIIQSGVEKG